MPDPGVDPLTESRPTPYYDEDGITIYHGETLNTLATLGTNSVDVIIGDPPYSSGGMFRGDRMADPIVKYRGWSQNDDGTRRPPTATYGTFGGDTRDQWAWIRWCAAWGTETLRITRTGGNTFLFTDWRQLPATTDVVQFSGWTWQGLVVWDKGSGRPAAGRFRNHLEYIVWASNGAHNRSLEYASSLIAVPTVPPNEREHVTQKPVALMKALLLVMGLVKPFTVLDPFMGVGSTLVAAKQLGHRAIGVDADERYCEVAATRLAQGVLGLEWTGTDV